MKEFRTYIFKEGKAKRIRNRREKIIGFLIVVSCPVALYYGFPVMGMIPLLVFGYIAYRMFKSFNKRLGLLKYGSKQAELVINEDFLEFHDHKYYYSDMSSLTIYVDEYTGMSKILSGRRHGGNNEINFIHDQQKFKFNYLIENPTQFRKVEQLVAQIEAKYTKQTNN